VRGLTLFDEFVLLLVNREKSARFLDLAQDFELCCEQVVVIGTMANAGTAMARYACELKKAPPAVVYAKIPSSAVTTER
jgi:hypothetical protein